MGAAVVGQLKCPVGFSLRDQEIEIVVIESLSIGQKRQLRIFVMKRSARPFKGRQGIAVDFVGVGGPVYVLVKIG